MNLEETQLNHTLLIVKEQKLHERKTSDITPSTPVLCTACVGTLCYCLFLHCGGEIYLSQNQSHFHALSTYCWTSTVQSYMYIITLHLVYSHSLRDRFYYQHFTDEKTKTLENINIQREYQYPNYFGQNKMPV